MPPSRSMHASGASSLRRQRIARRHDRHPPEPEGDTQVAVVVHAQALHEELQRHTGHDAPRDGKHHPVHRHPRFVTFAPRNLEPGRGQSGPQRLGQAAEERSPAHGAQAGVEREVEREGQGEALGDVVHEESHEDGEAQAGIGVVGGIGDEALGKLVQGDGDGGLQANAHEGILGNVMVVLGLDIGRGDGLSVRVVRLGGGLQEV